MNRENWPSNEVTASSPRARSRHQQQGLSSVGEKVLEVTSREHTLAGARPHVGGAYALLDCGAELSPSLPGVEPVAPRLAPVVSRSTRVRVDGKQFMRAGARYDVHGVTYGTFS